MGIADKAKNAAEDLVGKAREAVGDATNDNGMKTEGKKDQASSAFGVRPGAGESSSRVSRGQLAR